MLFSVSPFPMVCLGCDFVRIELRRAKWQLRIVQVAVRSSARMVLLGTELRAQQLATARAISHPCARKVRKLFQYAWAGVAGRGR